MGSAVTHLEIASVWIDVSIRETHDSTAQLTRHPVEEGADVTDHVRLQPDSIQIEGVVTNQPIEAPGSHTDGATFADTGFTLQSVDGGQLTRMRADGSASITIEGEPTMGLLGLLPGVDQAATLLRAVGVDARSKRQFQMVYPKEVLGTSNVHALALRASKPIDRVRAVHDALQAAFTARKPVQIITGLRVYEAVVLTNLSIMRDASSAGTLHFGATAEVIRMVKSASGTAGAPDPVHDRGKPKVDTGNQTPAEVAPAEVPADKVSAAKQIVGAISAWVHGQ